MRFATHILIKNVAKRFFLINLIKKCVSQLEFVSGYDKSGYINGYPVRSKYPDKDFFKLTLSGYSFNLNRFTEYKPLTCIIYPDIH